MILKASERGHAANLARHLMNARDNEHVALHELRGFVADDLEGALKEADAISRGTRCKNFLFSLSLSPPEHEPVSVEVFETAIEQIEQRLGLPNHPRAIVFHEKEGRRHAHAVWSRIDPVALKAINLPHYKRKLNDIARELYLEHGWDMPNGFKEGRSRDPLTFTLAEWQRAKRTGRDPKQLKATVQACWNGSDSKAALKASLRENGFLLAQGDRRGFVLVDLRGEVHSLSRLSGIKSKQLADRLGDPTALPTVEDQKAWLASRMTERLQKHIRALEDRHAKKGLVLEQHRRDLVARHRRARTALKVVQTDRWAQEERKRAARLPRGIKGIWSWITGRLKEVRLRNAHEIAQTERRDRDEREALIADQLKERRKLQTLVQSKRARQEKERSALDRDLSAYLALDAEARRDAERRGPSLDRPSRPVPGRRRGYRSQDQGPNGPDHEI
ncbi:MAG: relaxase/mobilization nuclease domain-containing protein [Pseudomonadota bacterium]